MIPLTIFLLGTIAVLVVVVITQKAGIERLNKELAHYHLVDFSKACQKAVDSIMPLIETHDFHPKKKKLTKKIK